MGRIINQFRRICGPESSTSVSANISNTDYSSINFLGSAENNEASHDSHNDTSHHIDTDSENDNIVCDFSLQADKPQLCQAKQAQKLVLGKTDASLVKSFLVNSGAPHLDPKALIRKLDEVARAVDLVVSTILEQYINDLLLGTVRSRTRKKTTSAIKSPEIQQSKGLLRYCQEFNRLPNEEERTGPFLQWTVGQARRWKSPYLSPFISIPCMLPTGTL